MANGVTTFSGKLKVAVSRDGTDGRYCEVEYGPFDLVGVMRAQTTTGMIYTQASDKWQFATGDGSSTGNIAGLCPASADALDFLMRVPRNFDSSAASYVDVYYHLSGAATKGDAVQWAVTYNNASINATTKALATSTTTTGITDATRRILATSKAQNYQYRDSATIAASTLTADTLPQVRVTAYGTYTKPELRVAKVVFRYARAFL